MICRNGHTKLDAGPCKICSRKSSLAYYYRNHEELKIKNRERSAEYRGGYKFIPRPRDPVDRFFLKVTYEPNTGCWLWVGQTQRFGYGHFKAFGEVTAHRASYIIHHGEIPSGGHVLHRCDVPQCVNPDHLFIGDQALNMADMKGKGRGHWQTNGAKENE